MDDNKKIVIFSFTRRANMLNQRIQAELSDRGYTCEGYTAARFKGTEMLATLDVDRKDWFKEQWGKKTFLFIGAAGIAVRYIAPWVRDKYTDSAVLVTDEKGEYVIPLLSGHMGGAVKSARIIAAAIHATAVITTATDVQDKFAVDVFARDHGLRITDKSLVKKVSAAVLEDEPVGFYSELLSADIRAASGLVRCDSFDQLADYACGIAVMRDASGVRACEDSDILILEPLRSRRIVAGVGCRRGASKEKIWTALKKLLDSHGLRAEDIVSLASIDLKKEEPGICELAEELGVPFHIYPASRLREVPGIIKGSDFVSEVTGTDNVCERAARCRAPKGNVLCPKQIVDGVALALVEEVKEDVPEVIVFGGTTESLRVFDFLKKFDLKITLSVATEYGRKGVREGGNAKVICGRMDREEILALIRENAFDLVIDATHPFATEATANIRWACREASAEYIRCLREETETLREREDRTVYAASIEEAVEYLRIRKGNVLITTGSKDLKKFCDLPDYQTRCCARVLSVTDSVKAAAGCGFAGKNLIAMQGPFSKEMNIAAIRYADAAYLVMKESGGAGGMNEKLKACYETGATPVVIRRPKENGSSVDEVCGYIEKRYQRYK